MGNVMCSPLTFCTQLKARFNAFLFLHNYINKSDHGGVTAPALRQIKVGVALEFTSNSNAGNKEINGKSLPTTTMKCAFN